MERRSSSVIQLVTSESEPALGDADLVHAFAKGESWAARAIWTRHAPMVYRLLERALGPNGDAADLTQDVFLRVLRKSETWQRDARFASWMYRIAQQQVCSHFLLRCMGLFVTKKAGGPPRHHRL